MGDRPLEEDIKKAVNSFLWCNLPDSTPLSDAEGIALVVLNKIKAAWDAHDKRTGPQPDKRGF